jgi:hypothetical protein
MKAPGHHRKRRAAESSAEYPTVVLLNERWRVIACPLGLQWILQRRAGKRHGTARWDGRSYCRTRDALIRVCRASLGRIGSDAQAALDALPERIDLKPGKVRASPLAATVPTADVTSARKARRRIQRIATSAFDAAPTSTL